MRKIQIHDYDKSLNYLVQRIGLMDISEKNRELLWRFKDALLLEGISKARVVRYFRFFTFLLGVFKKDLDSVTKQDIEAIVASINARENFSPTTKHDSKVMLKRFYKWLYGNDEEYPPEVKWIKSKVKRTEKKLPNDGELLTEQDVLKIIDAAQNCRDKALISALYESGCRVGELASLRIRDVSFGIIAP